MASLNLSTARNQLIALKAPRKQELRHAGDRRRKALPGRQQRWLTWVKNSHIKHAVQREKPSNEGA